MPRFLAKKRSAVAMLMVGLTLHQAACGTILHPERRGQPPGRLDPGIVVLDAVGLLLFFIPGVIAFAVDFSNGTIYLPPDLVYVGTAPAPDSSEALRTIRMSPGELSAERLEDILQKQVGRRVPLDPGSYHARKLQDIDEFSPATVEQMRSRPLPTNVIFPETHP